MKMKKLIFFTSLFLMGSQVAIFQSKAGDLPEINILKKYPQKELHLQDMANIEYVPLETTDDILLGENAQLCYVSDKYIVVYESIRGDIFVFDRTGKICSHFNHKGQSGQEYAWIGGGVIFDEKNEEIFVCSYSIQVYSLNGEYKRTLKKNTILDESKVFNFDDEALLVYDDVIVDPGMEHKTKQYPYMFISKKDGSLISVLDIHLPKRYSNFFVKHFDNNTWGGHVMYYPHSIQYGQDFMIADKSSDTLYLLTQDRKLTPLLTRNPSVHASEPRKIWATPLITDKFIQICEVTLDANLKGGRIPTFMYEFDTGEMSQVTFLHYGKRWSMVGSFSGIAKNVTAELLQASSVIEAYKRKQIQENVKEFIHTLSEDDNPVVRIVEFK